MKKFYISDTHFWHENIIGFDKRPFNNVEEMNAEIIDRWNKSVTNSDIVYIVGDFCWRQKEKWREVLKQLNGNKFLIKGNHDIDKIDEETKKMFVEVSTYKEVKDNGRLVLLSHYPMMMYKSSYNENIWHIYGHVHNSREYDYMLELTQTMVDTAIESGDESYNKGHAINVGCMLPYMDYTPRTLDYLIEVWKCLHIDIDNNDRRLL